MRNLFKALLCLFVTIPVLAQQTPFNGTIQAVNGVPAGPNNFLEVSLVNCGNTQPTVNGVSVILNAPIDFFPDVNGNLVTNTGAPATVFGNDVIQCGNIGFTSRYSVQQFVNGQPAGPTKYYFVQTAVPFNLNTAQPISILPPLVYPNPTSCPAGQYIIGLNNDLSPQCANLPSAASNAVVVNPAGNQEIDQPTGTTLAVGSPASKALIDSTGNIITPGNISANGNAFVVGTLSNGSGQPPALPASTPTGNQAVSFGALNSGQISGNFNHVTAGNFSGAGYDFWINGGLVFAKNIATGLVDITPNADAGLVIRTAIGNLGSSCGRMHFATGLYNINSLVLETGLGFSNYFGIGFPPTPSTSYCQWFVKGDGAVTVFNIQSPGTVFYVTPAAIASVPANAQIMAFWSRPNGSPFSNNIKFEDVTVQFPNSTRGNQTAFDSTQAQSVEYDDVIASEAVQPTAVPAAGSYGITTTQSGNNLNSMHHVYSVGYSVGIDVQSELTEIDNALVERADHCLDYGVRNPFSGPLITAQGTINNLACEFYLRGVTLGAFVNNFSNLNISVEFQDKPSGPWSPNVYHMKETNSGGTQGWVTASLFGASGSPTVFQGSPFDGGGGGNFDFFGQNVGRRAPVTYIIGVAAGTGATTPACDTADGFTCRMAAAFAAFTTGSNPTTGNLVQLTFPGINGSDHPLCTGFLVPASIGTVIPLYTTTQFNTSPFNSVELSVNTAPTANTSYFLETQCSY